MVTVQTEIPDMLGKASEHQISNQWDLYFNTSENMTSGTTSFHISPYEVQSVTLPTGAPQFDLKKLSNNYYLYNYRDISKEFSISVREDIHFKVFKYFKEWGESVWDEKSQTFRLNADDKVRYANIKFLHRDDSGEVTSCTFHLTDIKLKGISPSLDLSYDNGEPIVWKIDMIAEEISFDNN